MALDDVGRIALWPSHVPLKPPDAVSPELRAVEQQFDTAYKTSPLLKVHRGTALWTVLGVFEDRSVAPMLLPDPPNVQATMLRQNLLINALKHPLMWLQECPADGRLDARFDEGRYRGGLELSRLADAYETASTIFTYASRSGCRLELSGKEITPVPLVEAQDLRYYAYNRFLAVGENLDDPSPEDVATIAALANRVVVKENRFRVSVNPQLIKQLIAAYRPSIEHRFQLPGEWQTTQYRFSDFEAVFTALYVMAAIQCHARVVAVRNGVGDFGFADAVLVHEIQALEQRVVRYSGLEHRVVRLILNDLTYGARGVRKPDPALQPLIPLGGDRLAISPSLILTLSPERNLCVLLNSIPDEKRAYSAMVDQKEGLMRKRIAATSECARYRLVSGRVPGRSDLPDIDVALIDDAEKKLVILELKWFIAPDEVAEVLNRNEDLRCGIAQIKILVGAFCDGSRELLEKLQVTPEYRPCGAVVSQNWIGQQSIQDDAVPIVNIDHLLKAINRSTTMGDVIQWLAERQYLPIEDVHFTMAPGQVDLGGYKVQWFDIKPLIATTCDPTPREQ